MLVGTVGWLEAAAVVVVVVVVDVSFWLATNCCNSEVRCWFSCHHWQLNFIDMLFISWSAEPTLEPTLKHWTRLERHAKDKHSSLLRKSVNYDRKKFYSTSPRCGLIWNWPSVTNPWVNYATEIIIYTGNKWYSGVCRKGEPGNTYWRGKLSTVDHLALTG